MSMSTPAVPCKTAEVHVSNFLAKIGLKNYIDKSSKGLRLNWSN